MEHINLASVKLSRDDLGTGCGCADGRGSGQLRLTQGSQVRLFPQATLIFLRLLLMHAVVPGTLSNKQVLDHG
jgi:hypothetical protein